MGSNPAFSIVRKIPMKHRSLARIATIGGLLPLRLERARLTEHLNALPTFIHVQLALVTEKSMCKGTSHKGPKNSSSIFKISAVTPSSLILGIRLKPASFRASK